MEEKQRTETGEFSDESRDGWGRQPYVIGSPTAAPGAKDGEINDFIAAIDLGAAGPRLSVFGVEVRSWLGTEHEAEALRLAFEINRRAREVAPLAAARSATEYLALEMIGFAATGRCMACAAPIASHAYGSHADCPVRFADRHNESLRWKQRTQILALARKFAEANLTPDAKSASSNAGDVQDAAAGER